VSGISDVARAAGVSKSTASRALSGAGYVSAATRRRVTEAAAALGYVPSTPAVSLATGRTRMIGVILPYLNRWFFAEVLEGIQASLRAAGLDLTLYEAPPGTDDRRRMFDDFLARKRFDGLIAVALEPAEHELERLLTIGRPVVSVVGEEETTSTIALDDVGAARRATDHLIGLGHRRIAFVGGGAGDDWTRIDHRRLAGYRQAMEAAGLAEHVVHVRSATTLPEGYATAVDLLGGAGPRPTGIVALCDEVAIGTIIAARRLGIQVPSDMSVIGIDDHEYAEMFSLTTLRQEPREQGGAAVALLLQHLANPGMGVVTTRLEARLVVRNTTASVDRSRAAAVIDMNWAPGSGR